MPLCVSVFDFVPPVVIVSVPLCVSVFDLVPPVVIVSVPLCVSVRAPVSDLVPLVFSSS